MPADFERCQTNGGKIRTVSGPNAEHGLEADEYVHYCVLNNKSYRGEVHKKEKEKPEQAR